MNSLLEEYMIKVNNEQNMKWANLESAVQNNNLLLLKMQEKNTNKGTASSTNERSSTAIGDNDAVVQHIQQLMES